MAAPFSSTSRPMPHASQHARAPVGALLWIAGFGLCVLPFFLPARLAGRAGDDPVRGLGG